MKATQVNTLVNARFKASRIKRILWDIIEGVHVDQLPDKLRELHADATICAAQIDEVLHDDQ